MLLKIDTSGARDSLFFQQLTQLEERTYLLRFWWSDRESAWYLSVYDQDESPLALGLRLVVNWSLLRRFNDARLPPGMLFVLDTSGSESDIVDPTELQISERCPLFYLTSDELTTTDSSSSVSALGGVVGGIGGGGH